MAALRSLLQALVASGAKRASFYDDGSLKDIEFGAAVVAAQPEAQAPEPAIPANPYAALPPSRAPQTAYTGAPQHMNDPIRDLVLAELPEVALVASDYPDAVDEVFAFGLGLGEEVTA